MEEILTQAINKAIVRKTGQKIPIELSYPEEKFGDYSTNIALKLAKVLALNPRELASEIVKVLEVELKEDVKAINVAGPGFINFTLNDHSLLKQMSEPIDKPLLGQTIVVEFSDPNPFKSLHAGHLYSSIVGDVIANLLTKAGAKVIRLNYGGDVGLHVAKSLWAMINLLGGQNPDKLQAIESSNRSLWMSEAYVKGSEAYANDPSSAAEIAELNKQVYQIQASNDHDSALAKIYWTTRTWSYEAFEQFYQKINIRFDKYYPESEVVETAISVVNEQLKKHVFEMSDGAVVFKGEQYGLHTRVFINSRGIPTYEAKEVGLALSKYRDYKFDRSIIITASEQEQYMAVVYKAIEQFAPKIAELTTHLTHGLVKLAGGVKMSSRKGNTLTADQVLEASYYELSLVHANPDDLVSIAAVKYSMLKQRLGGDIVYDPKESISVIGNSGPYLQYAHARACSILSKVGSKPEAEIETNLNLNVEERRLLLKLSRYHQAIRIASSEFSPHVLCTYLYELTQVFSHFYETNRVVNGDNQNLRIKLVQYYQAILKDGLSILGIESPEHL